MLPHARAPCGAPCVPQLLSVRPWSFGSLHSSPLGFLVTRTHYREVLREQICFKFICLKGRCDSPSLQGFFTHLGTVHSGNPHSVKSECQLQGELCDSGKWLSLSEPWGGLCIPDHPERSQFSMSLLGTVVVLTAHQVPQHKINLDILLLRTRGSQAHASSL